jgi:small subunit ribosomal protein S6
MCLLPFHSWLTYGQDQGQTQGKEVSFMRNYEVFFIAQPDLDETAAAVVTDKIKGWITDGGGTVSKVDVWGKRHLAFPIKKQNEGLYILVQAEFAPSLCATLERNMRFLEPVLRFLITSVE